MSASAIAPTAQFATQSATGVPHATAGFEFVRAASVVEAVRIERANNAAAGRAPDVPKIEVGHGEHPSLFTSIGSPSAVMHPVEDDALKPFGVDVSIAPLSRERILSVIEKALETAA